jgi:hypothetical protein
MTVVATNHEISAPVAESENSNTLRPEDLPIHDWYRFVLSYPPHLVRRYLERFGLGAGQLVLDPFCGTGTTLVECRKQGVGAIGVEAHPLACLASRVKANWDLEPDALKRLLTLVIRAAKRAQAAVGLEPLDFAADLLAEPSPDYRTINEAELKLIPEGFVSPRPLQRLLILRDVIRGKTASEPVEVRDFFLLALAHAVANGAGNFSFGPEIYRTKAKADYDVLGHFALRVDRMIADLRAVATKRHRPTCRLVEGDARELAGVPHGEIDGVITSPPYPNEKDYTRITRVESVLLGLISDRPALRVVKERLLRSNTRNVFVGDEDGDWVRHNPRVQKIGIEIERRRVELGKNSGFEKLYHKVVRHYFGGMARHFAELRLRLKPGARCAYVVGDQLSFLLVPIPTASLLGEIAVEQGFREIGCDLWRTRLGTKSGTRVREEVLILEKN